MLRYELDLVAKRLLIKGVAYLIEPLLFANAEPS